MSIADIRKDYKLTTLDEQSVDRDPAVQFAKWLDEAIAGELPEPTAMTLATINGAGRPAARIVLLKAADASGFSFFTNYESNKGQELGDNPWAALVFHWAELERQVRIEGHVDKVSREESAEYFNKRPPMSRAAAWASPQSQVIENRQWLEQQFEGVTSRFEGEIPLPPFWGGYRVVPESIEFWQGRPNRLHDRLLYRRDPRDSWSMARLAP